MKSLVKLPLLALISCSLVSCVDSSPSKKSPGHIQNEVVQTDGSNINGVYAAEVWPVNYNLHFKTIGSVALVRKGDNFSAKTKLKYAPKDTVLRAALYTGRRCPNITDDLNKDAYIDILEARLAIGKITIPFDADLDSQMGGIYQNSSSDVTGKFEYEQMGSFERMFDDLKGADENPNDQIVKIKEREGLTFPGRIVLFQGLSSEVALPQTVAATDGESAHQSLPVACAVLWKVRAMPQDLLK